MYGIHKIFAFTDLPMYRRCPSHRLAKKLRLFVQIADCFLLIVIQISHNQLFVLITVYAYTRQIVRYYQLFI